MSKRYEKIVIALTHFRTLVNNYFSRDEESENMQIRKEINKLIPEIKTYFMQANIPTVFDYRAPAVVGGFTYTVDILEDMFSNEGGPFGINPDYVLDIIDRCIGAYEYLIKSGKSIFELQGKQTINIITKIELNLRALFKKEPDDEYQVQDNIEAILKISEVEYRREKERVPFSAKSYIPDFTIFDSQIALEVKLCNSKNDEKKIIDEINADITPYSTKYPVCLFVVYDVGGNIRDVNEFRRDFEKFHNVFVTVIKH